LLFTAPVAQRTSVAQAAGQSQTPVTRIGQIDAHCGLRLVDEQGQAVPNDFTSFDHFA
jgi:thiamine-monophosphate kinase